MSLVPVSTEEGQAREQSQATPDAWWIPCDPIRQRRLVLVLAKMARCVLDHTGEPPSESPVEETSDGQRRRLGATHLNKS